jgi:hypothetical protein
MASTGNLQTRHRYKQVSGSIPFRAVPLAAVQHDTDMEFNKEASEELPSQVLAHTDFRLLDASTYRPRSGFVEKERFERQSLCCRIARQCLVGIAGCFAFSHSDSGKFEHCWRELESVRPLIWW